MMSRIDIVGAFVRFPNFTAQNRGLINRIFGFRGAHFGRSVEVNHQIREFGLNDINIAARDGDRFGILGRNGAGKTTLLKMLSGIFEPTAGSISIKGRVSALTDITLGMDMEATGIENIRIQGVLYGQTTSDINNMIADVADFTGLGEYMYMPVRTYSSGMMLKLAFAVATARSPEIILMDEIIGVGDQGFVDKAHARLDGFIERVDILFLASHNENIIRKFCNKCLVMRDGAIVYEGGVEDALDFYRQSNV